MKVLIAGSRTITRYKAINYAFTLLPISTTHIISGQAPGVDELADAIATRRGISVIRRPADWSTYGKAAGHIRNKQMAIISDFAIILWDGHSTGTSNMLQHLAEHRVPTTVISKNNRSVHRLLRRYRKLSRYVILPPI